MADEPYGVLQLARAWLLLAAGYLALASTLVLLGADLRRAAGAGAGPLALNAALGLAATALAGAVLTWFAGATALALHRPHRAVSPGLAGRLARRAAALLLGLGLAGTLTPAASYAAERPAPPAANQPAQLGSPAGRWTPDRTATTDLTGWTPDRPATPATTLKGEISLVAAGPRAHAAVRDDDHDDTVVVRRGDTLWDITARHLGPGVGAGEIAAEWPRWYAANRAHIGADPDLIVPGTRLRPPTTR
jgi:nucleoid-associated protein YgaU